MAQNESDAAYSEIEQALVNLGAGVTFECDGGMYQGVLDAPDNNTDMMTGGFQGRTMIRLTATQSQFSAIPRQRGEVIITNARTGEKQQWQRKEVALDGANLFTFTLIRQLQVT